MHEILSIIACIRAIPHSHPPSSAHQLPPKISRVQCHAEIAATIFVYSRRAARIVAPHPHTSVYIYIHHTPTHSLASAGYKIARTLYRLAFLLSRPFYIYTHHAHSQRTLARIIYDICMYTVKEEKKDLSCCVPCPLSLSRRRHPLITPILHSHTRTQTARDSSTTYYCCTTTHRKREYIRARGRRGRTTRVRVLCTRTRR